MAEEISKDKEEFLEHFKKFPKGNPKTAYSEFVYHIHRKETFTGGKISKELIFKKWGEYIKMCRDQERDEKYIKSMESFIKSGEYNSVFTSSAMNSNPIIRTNKRKLRK